MPLYRYENARLELVPRSTLSAERIRERYDLQAALRQNIAILGDDLLVVAEEYALFDSSTRRIDLLAIDRDGKLVVIELKRTEDGGHMELQALRYAAMVSTMRTNQLYRAFAHYNHVDEEEAQTEILQWVGDPTKLERLSENVRIILVSADFSIEVTSTVMWLNESYQTDIQCFRIAVYKLGDDLFFDFQQIIPLPEAAAFQIHQREKNASAGARTSSGRDFTKYDLQIGDESFTQLSKQAAVKLAIQRLFAAGVDLELIRTCTLPQRWVPVRVPEGETVVGAFERQYPERRPVHLWFDLGIVEDGVTWVIPRYGGLDTEPMLSELAKAGRPVIDLSFRPSIGEDETIPGSV